MRPIVLAAAVLMGALACGRSPTATLEAMQEAAREGDAEKFASFFTEDSAPFARALLAVYRTQSVAGGEPSRPLKLLAESVVVDEKVEGDRAILSVRTGRDSERPSLLVFREVDGAWKLDIEQTERRNADAQ